MRYYIIIFTLLLLLGSSSCEHRNGQLELNTEGTSFCLSVLTVNDRDDFQWVQFGDGKQFSVPIDDKLIFIIYNGKYLSLGNAILNNDEIFVPYTILDEVGLVQQRTNKGEGTMTYNNGDTMLRIPWTSEDYTITINGKSIGGKRERIYYNDILYIPAKMILEPLGFTITYYEDIPCHDNYSAVVVSDNSRIANISIEQAEKHLNKAIKELYSNEIKKTELEIAEGRILYSDEAFERMKTDSTVASVEFVETYSDYYIFKLKDYSAYMYVNMYNLEVYFDDCWTLPNLCFTNGILKIADWYY